MYSEPIFSIQNTARMARTNPHPDIPRTARTTHHPTSRQARTARSAIKNQMRFPQGAPRGSKNQTPTRRARRAIRNQMRFMRGALRNEGESILRRANDGRAEEAIGRRDDAGPRR